MTYTTPLPIQTPFKAGETVEVCNRDLVAMSRVKVTRAGIKVVRLVDGRRFRASDGWYIGVGGAYPFPSIRHLDDATSAEEPLAGRSL